MRSSFPSLACALALAAACEPSGDALRGQTCMADADCASLLCVADPEAEPADLEPLPLVCDAFSDRAGPGEACAASDECDHSMCLLAGACALPCADDGDCGELQRCQAVFVRTSDATLQPATACVSMVDLPADTDVEVELRPGALSGERDVIELASADTGGGDTIYVLEHLQDEWPDTSFCRPPLCVAKLEAEGAAEPLFDASLDYGMEPPPRAVAVPGDHASPAVFRIDEALADELDGAALSATVDTEAPGDLRITRIHREQRGQRLDLNVFYLGALDWEPTGSRGPAQLEQALEVVDEIFAPADIFIGEVRQLAVPGGLPERGVAFPEGGAGAGFAVLEVRFGVYVELPHLFMLSAGASNGAVNLFFVEDIRPRTGGEPEAEAGGVPGPPAMQGTAGSGIAISTDMMAGDARGLGRTLAHELAHYLGLFHTSESSGVVYDRLNDTPECRAGDDCSGHEANLMWWAKASGIELSAGQVEVLRRAPLLR
jgi:hypothetical protein